MPVIYETTAKIGENGHLFVEIDDLPFEEGTQFLIKLIPQVPFDSEAFKKQMQSFINECAKNSPYGDMTKTQILTELREQREKMYHEDGEN